MEVDEHGTVLIVWYVASGLNGCVLPWDTAMSTAAKASARASKVSSRLANMLLCNCKGEDGRMRGCEMGNKRGRDMENKEKKRRDQ